MITYGDSTLPGDSVSVRERETTQVSRGFDASVAIVGGYDASNGTISASDEGTAIRVRDGTEAANKFGDGSELHRQTQLAQANGADVVYCVPVPETTNTETFAGTSSGTIPDAPIFDPNVNSEHDVSATDTVASASVTVNIVYDDTPSAPSETNTINLNPVSGEWVADESADYDITYSYGTYDNGAIEAASKKDPRCLVVCTEDESLVTTGDSTTKDRATDFSFMHNFGGAGPEIPDPSAYSDSLESAWTCVIAHPRGYFDNDAEPEVRTHGAVAGAVAGSTLTESTTTQKLNGIASMRTEHTPTEIAGFGDADHDSSNDNIEGVLPLIDRGGVEIVEDLTTDPDGDFRSLYKHEIVNDLSYSIHLVAREFVSEPNTANAREQDLLVPTENLLSSAADQSPPMLHDPTSEGDPYIVSVDVGSSDDTSVLTVGMDPLDVTKHVEVEINAGSVVTFGGISS